MAAQLGAFLQHLAGSLTFSETFERLHRQHGFEGRSHRTGGTSGYAAAKEAIMELTVQWAEELSSYGIRVNAIVPSEGMTPQYDDWLKKFEKPVEELRKIVERIPLGHRMTVPDEIAAMAIFLLSSRSEGLTGQRLFVDGGYVHLDRRLT